MMKYLFGFLLLTTPALADSLWGIDLPPGEQGRMIQDFFARPIHSPELDQGGNPADYWRNATAIIASHPKGQTRLPTDCESSCTMLLIIPGACIVEGGSLWFHSVYDDRTGELLPNSIWQSELWTAYSKFPRLKAFIQANGWLDSFWMHEMKFEQAIKLGVPRCEL